MEVKIDFDDIHLRARALTSGDGVRSYAPAPDGKSAVVTRGGDFWSVTIANGTLTKLTATPEPGDTPRFPSTGTKFYYLGQGGSIRSLAAGPPAPPATAGTTTTVNPDVRQASFRDPEYQKQRDALMEEAQARLAAMPEAEREKVRASLATLRRSILEIEAALGRDPANALLQELFVSSCQEEMRALTAVRDSGSQEI